jgi:HEAT repeat protein
MPNVDLNDWIRRIRSPNAATFEDAYYGDRPEGDDVVPRLIEEMHASPDPYTRGKFAELLGEMDDERAVPPLVAELRHPDAEMRGWALRALAELGTPAAAEAARLHREQHPEDG